jgi:hypothetical protein
MYLDLKLETGFQKSRSEVRGSKRSNDFEVLILTKNN